MNSIFQALGGSGLPSVQQPSAPVPPGSPGFGTGSIYDALQQAQPIQDPSAGAPPLQVASNSDPGRKSFEDSFRKATGTPAATPIQGASPAATPNNYTSPALSSKQFGGRL